MFTVKRVAAAIRTAFDKGGELPVIVELRPLFPITLASPIAIRRGLLPGPSSAGRVSVISLLENDRKIAHG
jgi:hypothetical protein